MTTLCHWRVLGFIPHLFSAANSGMSAKPRPIRPRFALALRSAGRAGGGRSFASRPEEAVPLGAGPAPTLLVMQDVRAIHSSGCNHSIEIAEVSLSFLLPSFFTFFITSFLPASVPSLYSSVLRSFPSFFHPFSRPPFFPSAPFSLLRSVGGSWYAWVPRVEKKRISRMASVGIPGSLEAEVAVVAA